MTPVCVGSVESGVTSRDRSGDSSGCHLESKTPLCLDSEPTHRKLNLKQFKAHTESLITLTFKKRHHTNSLPVVFFFFFCVFNTRTYCITLGCCVLRSTTQRISMMILQGLCLLGCGQQIANRSMEFEKFAIGM